jgi:uncharacterized protein (DUF58 family)
MSAGVTVSLDELIKLQADAHGFSFLPRQPVASLLAGRHASRLRGRGLAFAELRRYVDGDDPRTIDWRATARLQATHVRVYEEERERSLLLVVDQRRAMFFGSRRAMKSVAAAEVAALAAWSALAAGDRVGGIVFNDDEIIELRPHRSRTRVLRILGEVARVNRSLVQAPTAHGDVTLNDALEAASRCAPHDHLVVLISDLDGADTDTHRLATRLAAHNDVLVVGIYDPLGASLQGHPGMLASDRGAVYAIPAAVSFAAAFQRAFEAHVGRWREVFRALRVPVLPISTHEPAALQVRALFGQRGALR